MANTYNTINVNSTYLLKEKKSKFCGYAFPVLDVKIIKKHIDDLKRYIIQQDTFAMPTKLG